MHAEMNTTMPETAEGSGFPSINRGYHSVFKSGAMSIGLVVPIENYVDGPVPTMCRQVDRIQLAEKLGFSAVWLRDVPFNVPSFGDAGQVYDPFVFLGTLAGATEEIALGMASIILPLRHPAHVAKAAATADVLSKGRLILGVASGDRPAEYPALNIPFEDRGLRFRESFNYIRQMATSRPEFENEFGNPGQGMDMLPKPTAGTLPLLVTGGSQQKTEWIAQNGDGWMLYPRAASTQAEIAAKWKQWVKDAGRPPQPLMQPLYIDLVADPGEPPRPIHLGFRSGTSHLLSYLKSLKSAGLNHVALNLRFNQAEMEPTLHRLAEEVLPQFND